MQFNCHSHNSSNLSQISLLTMLFHIHMYIYIHCFRAFVCTIPNWVISILCIENVFNTNQSGVEVRKLRLGPFTESTHTNGTNSESITKEDTRDGTLLFSSSYSNGLGEVTLVFGPHFPPKHIAVPSASQIQSLVKEKKEEGLQHFHK